MYTHTWFFFVLFRFVFSIRVRESVYAHGYAISEGEGRAGENFGRTLDRTYRTHYRRGFFFFGRVRRSACTRGQGGGRRGGGRGRVPRCMHGIISPEFGFSGPTGGDGQASK